ncbi:MAG TPA: ABC transporter permease [Candidatus Saccharimonadales bacterium]|nr:ABC transporter permease [Candidatus Saccharimonadales bacterium]
MSPASQLSPVSGEITLEGGDVITSGSFGRMILEVFLQSRLATIGLGVIVLMVLFCFVGPLIYHTQQIYNNPNVATQTPSLAHPLGTDEVGYDVLGRLMVGGQSSLEIAFAAALMAVSIGVVWGAIAGLAGGLLDAVMMRIVDTLLAFPFLFALILLGAIFSTSILELIIVIGLVAWLVPARLVRAESLTLRVREYVQAVLIMGGSRRRVLFRHIIPNTVGTVVVNATFQIADAIIFVATLSYLGIGVPPPATNWGGELASGLSYIADGYWWLIYPPGIAIVLTVVAFNFVGDALRDALEVRLQRR